MDMSAIPSGKRTTVKRWALVIGFLLVMIGSRSVGLAAQAVVPPAIIQKLQAERIARVIVRLDVQTRSEGTLDTPQAVGAQRQAIGSAQTFLLAELTRTGHRMIRRFQTIPFLVLEVEADAVAMLEHSSLVMGLRRIVWTHLCEHRVCHWSRRTKLGQLVLMVPVGRWRFWILAWTTPILF